MTVTMASTTDARKPAPGAAYGCVRFVFVRGGTLILDTGRNKPLFARASDVVLVAAGIELRSVSNSGSFLKA
ncbi:hypothetical protein [Micromonospora sp. MW-13]|uniref:hypothetical protein n=1 Tax=Micromonospora sp. MW-13 TaxID=2094022 RepID=UPI000FFE980E|nr:hypothetical protein [Micromonospora sp. MW-13]